MKEKRFVVDDSSSLGTVVVSVRHPPGSKWENCVELYVERKGCGCPEGQIMLSAVDWAKLVRAMGKAVRL
jgi:hypothetical protein